MLPTRSTVDCEILSGSRSACPGESLGLSHALRGPDSFGGTYMDTFSIPDWRKSQRYTDRRPKFFSVYSTIREEVEFLCANRGVTGPTDSEMGQILGILCLATKHDNPQTMPDGPSLPMDPSWVRKQAGLDSEPDLKRLVSMGVISCNNLSQVVTDPVVSVTREEQREKSIVEKIKKADFVLSVPLKDGSFHGITQQQINHYAELYPRVNIVDELRILVGWNEADPSRRKTRKGIEKHINFWLGGKLSQLPPVPPSIAERASARAEEDKRKAEEKPVTEDKPFKSYRQMIKDGDIADNDWTNQLARRQEIDQLKASQDGGTA